MIRPTVATVDLAAIEANFREIQSLLSRSARGSRRAFSPSAGGGAPAPTKEDSESASVGIIAVLKANAYGHGASEVGQVLERAGASMLACADIEEGVSLRESGITLPILVFGALSVSDLDGVFDHRLTPTVSTPAACAALERAAAARNQQLRCHLKIDTGMNRLGFRHDNLQRTMPEVLGSPHLEIDAVYTHFATADLPESPFLDEQRARFDRATAALGALGLRGFTRHAANSAAILRDTRTWYEAVRPGLLLYGIVPPPLAAGDLHLRPALSLTSRIVAVKGMRRGEGTGYGRTWRAGAPTCVATIPIGYGDGWRRALSNNADVLIRGRRHPLVGTVSMDNITVDLGSETDVEPGDEVVLIGRHGGERILAEEVARRLGTINYEVTCGISARVPREHG